MIEKKYSVAVTAVKTGSPLLIVIISQALHAALVASGIQVDIGDIYTLTTVVYSVIIGIKNVVKNRNKKGLTADGFNNKKINFD
jgi:hypothetical protein